MRVVIQRVATASVTVEGQITGAIERGLLVCDGVTGEAEEQWERGKAETSRGTLPPANKVRGTSYAHLLQFQGRVV